MSREQEGDKVVFETEAPGGRILKRTVVSFRDEGIIMSVYDLHTIEKDMRFVEHPKAHWEWGIVINKGLEPSQFVRKTDVAMWYQSEAVRDQRYDKMLSTLATEGLTIVEI